MKSEIDPFGSGPDWNVGPEPGVLNYTHVIFVKELPIVFKGYVYILKIIFDIGQQRQKLLTEIILLTVVQQRPP